MILSISQLKARFLKGMKPTAEDFANLIDSFVHKQGTQAKVVFDTETITVSVESNTITSLGMYANIDAIDVFCNGVLADVTFTPPSTFLFTQDLDIGSVIKIRKYSVQM